MKKVYVILADGFEEMEMVTPVDLLRRAGIDCQTVSITGKQTVKGARGIPVEADKLFSDDILKQADGIVLPGGMPGTLGLMEHQALRKGIVEHFHNQKLVAAICAAPMILADLGILEGKKATIYPGMEKELKGACPSEEPVCIAGNIITSRGAGTAIAFSLAIIEHILDSQTAAGVRDSIVYAVEP